MALPAGVTRHVILSRVLLPRHVRHRDYFSIALPTRNPVPSDYYTVGCSVEEEERSRDVENGNVAELRVDGWWPCDVIRTNLEASRLPR